MAEMELTSLSEHVNKAWGEMGTPERDAMEVQLKDEVDAYFVGEAIRKARLKQNISQEELGERIAIKKAE